MTYRLITDATADLSPEMLQHDCTIIPMEIVVDDTLYSYGPGGNITIEEFYSLLRSGKFGSTSQINPAVYEDVFRPYLDAGEDILYLCFTSGMSGMYRNAKEAMEQLKKEFPERKMVCIDTKCASLGEGFLVREVLEKKAEGCSMEELVEWITARRNQVCQWFTVDTFSHLRHGGRVSSAGAVIGTTLQIKPLLHVSENGELEVVDRTIRGTKRAMAALLQRMKNGWQPELGTKVIVGHGDCLDAGEKIAEMIRTEFPTAEITVAPIGPVIGSHTGPGLLAVVFWGSER